mgnify:CR=1 FL=1
MDYHSELLYSIIQFLDDKDHGTRSARDMIYDIVELEMNLYPERYESLPNKENNQKIHDALKRSKFIKQRMKKRDKEIQKVADENKRLKQE